MTGQPKGVILTHRALGDRSRLRDRYTTLEKQTSHLRDQGDTMIEQPLPSTVEALDVLLDNRCLRHAAHVWLLNSNAYCLGIVAVILLALQERLHILRRDDLHSMPLSFKMPLPVKGTRASFDPDQAWRQCLEESNDIVAAHRRACTNRGPAPQIRQIELYFAYFPQNKPRIHW